MSKETFSNLSAPAYIETDGTYPDATPLEDDAWLDFSKETTPGVMSIDEFNARRDAHEFAVVSASEAVEYVRLEDMSDLRSAHEAGARIREYRLAA